VIKLDVTREAWPIRGSFAISRGTKTAAEVLVVQLTDGDHRGRGECVPYARYGESLDSVTAQIKGLRPRLEAGDLNRHTLQEALPAGAARNAVDCAFWDLEAKRAGEPAWKRAQLSPPAPVTTAYTISLGTVEEMAAAAAANARRPLLKLKLAGPDDLRRVEAVRAAAPEAKLIVDANEGWTVAQYEGLARALGDLGVAMIEQPLPAGEDDGLLGLPRPVPLCADESCHDRASLTSLAGKYDLVNIKLDKAGGLTEALALKAEARAAGFGVMVGCMVATSLGIAPALLLAQGAEVVDLDGPLLLSKDRIEGLTYDGSRVSPPTAGLWG